MVELARKLVPTCVPVEGGWPVSRPGCAEHEVVLAYVVSERSDSRMPILKLAAPIFRLLMGRYSNAEFEPAAKSVSGKRSWR